MSEIVDFKSLRSIDTSNFVAYSAISVGYVWMSPELSRKVYEVIKKHNTIEDIFDDNYILNFIGMELLGMPYTENPDGSWSFKPPALDSDSSEYIKNMQVVGEVYKRIIKPIQTKKKVFFIHKTSFILYNNKIEIRDAEDISDVNILNIVVNVMSVYTIQKYREGILNG